MKIIKKILGEFLLFIGCKDLSVMLYGLKHFNMKLLMDGIFYGKYIYLPVDAPERKNIKEWKKYLSNRENYNSLIRGLDKVSIETVNQVENNIGLIINSNDDCFEKKKIGIKESELKINKVIRSYTKYIYLPINHLEQTCFYYKHGINFVDNLQFKMGGKDIIDCGAFIGDSAMMFSKEMGFESDGGIIKCIYCLEPEPTNVKLLEKTISNNGMKGKIIPIPLGVGNKKEKVYISDSLSGSVMIDNYDDSANLINVDTIDNIVKDYCINPGLIKWDIEGLEYDSLLGSKKTIEKYKPVLLISIYHNGRDFYCIKPLIESRNLGYKFKIRHLSTQPYAETMLICY